MKLAQYWYRIFNVLLAMQALAILGGAIYCAATSMSDFVYVLGGVGLFVLLLSVLGLLLINTYRLGWVKLYSIGLFMLLVLHLLVVIGYLFYEDKTLEVLQKLNAKGGEQNTAVFRYLDSHRSQFRWAAFSTLIVEFISFCICVCYGQWLSGKRDERGQHYLHLGNKDGNKGLLSSEVAFTGASATPQTDAKRAELNEKYGGAFNKSTNYSRGNYYSQV